MRGKLTRRAFLQEGFLAALGAGMMSCAGPQRTVEITPVELTRIPTTLSDEIPPLSELYEARFYLQLDGFSSDQILENRLAE